MFGSVRRFEHHACYRCTDGVVTITFTDEPLLRLTCEADGGKTGGSVVRFVKMDRNQGYSTGDNSLQ